MALWATQIAMGARGFSATIGREMTADDIEPVNWVLIQQAGGSLPSTTPRARPRVGPSDGRCSSGGPTGGICCSRRAGRTAAAATGLRERSRASHGTAAPRRSVRRLHSAVQHERAARDDLPLHRNAAGPTDRNPARRRLRREDVQHSRCCPTGVGAPLGRHFTRRSVEPVAFSLAAWSARLSAPPVDGVPAATSWSTSSFPIRR